MPTLASPRAFLAAALLAVAAVPLEAQTGYVGITLSPTSNRMRNDGEGGLYIRYFEYPSIISVDPSSPAERAGLARGDTVIAFDGMDVREELPMHELLAAGRRLRVSIRREGRGRSVDLTVAPAPAVVQGRRVEFFVPGPPAPRAVREARVRRPIAAPRPPVAVVAPRMHFELARGIAGAELKELTRGLAAAVGVRRGLLVMAVAPQSPAAAAGLRDGDVILEADGQETPDLPTLSRVMRSSTDRSVALEIRREGRKRKLDLAW